MYSKKIVSALSCLLLICTPLLASCGSVTSTVDTALSKQDIEKQLVNKYSQIPSIQKMAKIFGKNMPTKLALCVADKMMATYKNEKIKAILNGGQVSDDIKSKFSDMNRQCGEKIGQEWAENQSK